VKVFRSLGFGTAVVQRKEINEELLSSLFYVNLAVSCLLALVLVAGAPLFAWIYGDQRVGPIIAVLSITYLLAGPALIPSALLTRRMAFDQLAIREVLTAIVKGATGISLALLGWGVWALVWATIVGSATQTVLVYTLCRWHPRLVFRWGEVRGVLSFGAHLTGSHVFNYFTRNSDKFIIGAFLGPIALGFYSLSYRILLLPRDAITRVVGRVLLPSFSRMQDDDARLKAAYLRVCGAIAFVTFPMMLGMFVVARPFVEVLLGAKWLPAVPLICVLAPLGMLQSVILPVGQLYLAKGRTDWLFRWSTVRGTLYVCSFLMGIPWGVLGVTVSYALMYCALVVPSLWIPFKLVDGLRIRDFFLVVVPYATWAGMMALLVAICRMLLEGAGVGPTIILPVCIALGLVSYTVIILGKRPRALDDFLRLLPEQWSSIIRRLQRVP